MDNLVQRFLNKIGVKADKEFEKAYFSELFSLSEKNTVVATLSLENILPCKTYYQLFEKICDAEEIHHFITKLSFKYKNKPDVYLFLDDYLQATKFSFEMSNYEFFNEKKEKSKLVFYYNNENEDILKQQVEEFKQFCEKINLTFFDVCCVFKNEEIELSQEDETIDDYSIDDEIVESKPEVLIEAIDQEKLNEMEFERTKTSQKFAIQMKKEQKEKEKLENQLYEVSIKDCYQFKNVLITGKIFKQELTTFKSGKHILTLYVTDYTSSIIVKIFESKKYPLEYLQSFKDNQRVKIRGVITEDTFLNNHKYLQPTRINLLEDEPLKTDNHETKRVELHLHTKVSTYDGVNTITDYFKLAKQYNMRGLAVTDHAVVQVYPEAQKAAKKYNLKMLYGSELYMVDDKIDYIHNPSDEILKDATYVVFDLETTGLSARYDRIIEFGAVKYKNGQIVDTVDFFINPDREISAKITQLTNITNEQVKYGKPIKEALNMIKRFVGDSILVSHNATFDVGFLNEALKNNNMEQMKNPVIDTLPISRYLFPDQRSHRLEALCRNFSVTYSESSAHRADYDAQVLQECFVAMLEILTKNNINMRHKELNDLHSDKVILTSRPTHITVYAKNQEGLKDLFEIISISNLQYFKNLPRIPKSILQEKRKNLIFGSACQNGEVFDCALTRSEDIVREKMKFYDFIEIQPYTNYVNLVNEGSIQSLDQIKMIIKDIISAAQKENKLICATGDVHYLQKEDKIFRDIYIFAKGLKESRHPLNPFARDHMPYYDNPDQGFLSTDEMIEKFSFLEDEKLIEEIVVTNTNKILDMAEDVYPIKDKLYTPNIENCKEKLLALIDSNAKKTYGDPLPAEIKNRLDAELKGIDENNYYVIYYIASQLVGIANKDGYLVGSRGSVGSSLVATMAGITEVNPLPPHYICPKCHHLEWVDPVKVLSGYDLPDKKCPHCNTKMKGDGQNIPFATFLGFKAEKVPDIDLNFPSDYQAHAHELTKDLLGKDNVFKAGTIETVAEKTAIKHVLSYFEHLQKDLNTIPKAEVTRLAIGCTDVKRTTGQHPGGIIVIPNDMSVFDFTPIQYPADDPNSSWKTTHFDFHAIHDNVLKLDLLGHVDPYALRLMQDMTNVDVKTVPFNDKNVMLLFTSTKPLKLKNNLLNQTNGALGLPEFGSALGRRILNETKPHSFDDLVRISGLSHGTGVYQGNAQDFILSGKGTLHDVIGCRDDIMTGLHDKYNIDSQESFKLMEIVRKGNYMKPDFAEKRAYFEKLMRDHNVPDDYIHSCEKIEYLFPKGHAVAYCMMAVRIAYFKVYYPLAYYATYFTVRSKAYDLENMCKGKVAILKEINRIKEMKVNSRTPIEPRLENVYDTLTIALEMEDRGYSMETLDVNKSLAIQFTIDKQTNKIIPPFSAVDGLGVNTAIQIVEARNKYGKFYTVEDFIQKTKMGETTIAALRKLNAFKDMPESNQLNLFEGMF